MDEHGVDEARHVRVAWPIRPTDPHEESWAGSTLEMLHASARHGGSRWRCGPGSEESGDRSPRDDAWCSAGLGTDRAPSAREAGAPPLSDAPGRGRAVAASTAKFNLERSSIVSRRLISRASPSVTSNAAGLGTTL